MKITISQQDKKILVRFRHGRVVDNYPIDKAEDFLLAIDKFVKKHKIRPMSRIGPMGPIEFKNTSMLTERVIRAIIAGLRF